MSAAGAALAALLLAATPAAASDPAVVDGLAQVLTDGSLRINGRTISLAGLFLPEESRICSSVVRPARCGSASALALERRAQGFVRCEIVGRGYNGALAGFCSVQGRDLFGPRVDLGASLVIDGLALADDGAPARYRALERLARSRGVGLWDDGITQFR